MKVSIAAAALILALSAIPYSYGQCSGSGFVGSNEYCCDAKPFCCDASSSGCPLKGCTANNIVEECGSINFDVNCEYEEPVQCDPDVCAGLTGDGDESNCPKKCKEGTNTDCNKELEDLCEVDKPTCPDGDFNPSTCECGCDQCDPGICDSLTGDGDEAACNFVCPEEVNNDCTLSPDDLCEVDKPTSCPEGKPFNPETCACGCEVDLDCLTLDVDNPCPECIDGRCERRSCPSNKACCKRTRGNDLVCSQGCGKQNICLDNLIDGGPYCERPALALCSALCPEGGCPVPGTEDMFYDAFDDCANP